MNLIQDRLVNFLLFLKFWFDESFQQIISEPYDCACCESGASQCGYPMHNKCKYDSDETGEGCPGDYNKLIFPKISFQNLALLKFKKIASTLGYSFRYDKFQRCVSGCDFVSWIWSISYFKFFSYKLSHRQNLTFSKIWTVDPEPLKTIDFCWKSILMLLEIEFLSCCMLKTRAWDKAEISTLVEISFCWFCFYL